MHYDMAIDQQKKKTEIITYYNVTKCVVDLLDMKCAAYATNRQTRLWPLAIVYRLLSIFSVNTYILY